MGCFVVHCDRESPVPMRGCRYAAYRSEPIYGLMYIYCCAYVIKSKYMFTHSYAQNIHLQQCSLEVPQDSVLSFVTRTIVLHPFSPGKSFSFRTYL